MSLSLDIEDETGLTAKDIMTKIRGFKTRYDWWNTNDLIGLDVSFLYYLNRYPQSLCNRTISEKLKLIIALYHEEDTESSYEEISQLFDRSKSTISQAINEKGEEARALLAQQKLRTKARDIAMEELIQEEKTKLLTEKTNTQ